MEFYISPQSGQFYMINVLENQWLSVTLRLRPTAYPAITRCDVGLPNFAYRLVGLDLIILRNCNTFLPNVSLITITFLWRYRYAIRNQGLKDAINYYEYHVTTY